LTTAIEEPLLTRLVRAADCDGFEVRRGLRELRQRLEPPREFYTVQKSARPAHAIIPLPLGAGDDPAVLQKAIKRLRQRLDKSGTGALIFKRDSPVYVAYSPAATRRRKQRAARARLRRHARKRTRGELRGL